MKTFIYALFCPIDNTPRYVGKSNEMRFPYRLKEHVRPSTLKTNTHKNNWIKWLLKQGKKPIIKIIDIGDENTYALKEKYWVKCYKKLGFDLTNATEGGEGMARLKDKRVIKEEQKINISNTLKKLYKEHPEIITKAIPKIVATRATQNTNKNSKFKKGISLCHLGYRTYASKHHNRIEIAITKTLEEAVFIKDVVYLLLYPNAYVPINDIKTYENLDKLEFIKKILRKSYSSRFYGVNKYGKKWAVRDKNDNRVGVFETEEAAAQQSAIIRNSNIESITRKDKFDIFMEMLSDKTY